MLKNSDERRILDLLNQGYSEIKVQRLTGFSRNAIRRLHRQKIRLRPRQAVEVCFSYLLQLETDKEGTCPTCGLKVKFPCKSCLLSQYNKLFPSGELTNNFACILEVKRELDNLEKLDPDEEPEEEDAHSQD